jgi:hypothetical protein
MNVGIPQLIPSTKRNEVLSDYHQASAFGCDNFYASTQANVIGSWCGKG